MRWNRGTIALIAALVIIIIVVLVVNNQQASAPAATPTVQVASGPLLPGIDGTKVVSYEVIDNVSGDFTTLSKDTGGAWHITATNSLGGRDPDQDEINTTVGQIATLNYNNTFQDSQLSNFGLDAPSYTIKVTTSDSQLYTIYVGSKSPTSAGYYAVVQQGNAPAATAAPGGAATAEATAKPDGTSKLVFPLAQATAEATAAPSAEVTAEATQAIAATAESTAEATGESTAEFTPEATVPVVRNASVTLSGNQTIYVVPQTVINTLTAWLTTPPYAPLPTATPTEEVTPAVTATAETTAEATAAATAAATQSATTEATAAATAAS